MASPAQKRGRIKASITRIETYVKGLSDNFNTHELNIREGMLEKYFNDYCDIQNAIEDSLDETDPRYDEQLSDRENTENKYVLIKAKIKELLANRSPSRSSSPVAPAWYQPPHPPPPAIQVKLPSMNIPTFQGNYGEWRTFFDLYVASVHSNSSLGNAQKFVYLKSFLKGEPLCLISELAITDNNYQKAFDILKERYDKKLPVINYHINGLLNIGVPQKNSQGLREFVSKIRQHINALEALNVQVFQNWDLILVNIFANKLDKFLRNEFELGRDQNEMPTLEEFLEFLGKRISAWEVSEQNLDKNKSVDNRFQYKNKGNFKAVHTSVERDNNENIGQGDQIVVQHATEFICGFCKGINHSIARCRKFEVLKLSEKRNFVVQNRLCFNCLKSGHRVMDCRRDKCRFCSGKHHSLLHENRTNSQSEIKNEQMANHTTSDNNVQQGGELQCLATLNRDPVLLSTARVKVMGSNGEAYQFRALLDCASQSSFVTTEAVSLLGIKPKGVNLQISGVSQNKSRVTQSVCLNIGSQYLDKSFFGNFGVLETITCNLPQTFIDVSRLKIPSGIDLADKEFNIPDKIDMLIGADFYFNLLEPGIVSLGTDLPRLVNTKLGWILGGSFRVDTVNLSTNVSVVLFSTNEIEQLIPKFWQLEELSSKRILSPDDKKCEHIFETTTARNAEGRFIVNLPLKGEINKLNLGNSFDIAERRFFALERRLVKNPALYQQYRDFIDEYVRLGHAKYFCLKEDEIKFRNFIAHHGVVRDESVTTKLRVVFDSSMKTTSGLSLNEVMFKGPTVQAELFDIICRFRLFRYVLMTDVEKMFRQVLINKEHLHLQNILWRKSPEEDLSGLELQTVSYGTNCAPYLATRCLIQLAKEGVESHPIASEALFKQCYVDDILSGSNTIQGLEHLRDQLIELLGQGGFSLHKWVSNVPGFVQGSNSNLSNTIDSVDVNLHANECMSKVLGIKWQPLTDNFVVCDFPMENNYALTKRNILSQIARLFDPLGFVSPVIVTAKIIMQRIWASKIDWDEVAADDICQDWLSFAKNITYLARVRIPRLLFESHKIVKCFELHGFADASQKAYGTCFYLRTIYESNEVNCRLIASKSRVAPIKVQTLPRLELCSAVLMAKLCHKLCSVLELKISKVVLWSDSKITLCWIHSDPNRWTTFVSNRVSEIQELTSNHHWLHVPGDQNPADHISRGLDPCTFISCDIWWQGPEFLYDPNVVFKRPDNMGMVNLPEQRENIVFNVATKAASNALQIFENYSSFRKLNRVVAYCLRFVNNCSKSKVKFSGVLSVDELKYSQETILKCVQNFHFHKEIETLKKNRPISSGPLVQLAPFMDESNLVRVNSRLSQSNVPLSQKYPIILPRKDHTVNLILKHEHVILCHAGPQMVLANLRQRFWPINGLRNIKNIIKGCLICHRFKAASAKQIMAPLPKDRTSITRPFLKVGIDYGGPFVVKESRLRRSATYKAYLALFVCMTTKAIHLELVSSLSSDAFVSSLKRFISRRGCPEIIYSDNGTNFHGANNSLAELSEFLKKNGDLIQNYLSLKEVRWKFIPPGSPHWGGLWEAGIKSTKFHLKRVIGSTVLTFEQFTTVLCEIEAILNSRPLTPISSDPLDMSCLTPGHFLVGSMLTALPEKDLSITSDNRLGFWEQCQKIRQCFWKRWSVEFLSRLQNRPKWRDISKNLQVNDMVLLREDNLPPIEWKLARIVETFPGKDSHTRAVKVRTKDGVFTRPITKLCPLPFNSSNGGEDVDDGGTPLELSSLHSGRTTALCGKSSPFSFPRESENESQ